MHFFSDSKNRLGAFVGAALVMTAAIAPALAEDSGPPTEASRSAGDRTQEVRGAIKGGGARNVILFIGDGMGDSEITIARNYERGAAGRLAMDWLPLTGSYTTYSVQKGAPDKPEYLPDSSATATAWATGTKTYNGAVSVDAFGKPVQTLLELARSTGLRTGNVTTAEVQDATPAVLGSHVIMRTCKGPQSMQDCPVNAKENGGAGSIAEQTIASRADVVLGGGRKYFDQTVQAGEFKGQTVLDQALKEGYRLVTDRAELAAAGSDKPVLGLFAEGNLAVQWSGPAAKVGGTPPSTCQPNVALPASEPKLVDMTRKAIDLLDRQSRDAKGSKGFFLQVEGASIDKEDHAANPCGQIGETIGLDDAVEAGLAYARSNPDTLVIVTADHGHSSQIVPTWGNSPGQTATLITNEGGAMTINYGTGIAGQSQEHTGTQVRIAGYGPQAANVVGLTDQTELFRTIKRALDLR